MMRKAMEDRQEAWEASYAARQNYLFYPHEEVIRFFSKHVRKRIGLDECLDIINCDGLRALDLGCGIGRHVVYAHEMGLEAYGVDLSETAVGFARSWAAKVGVRDPKRNIVVASAERLPWPNAYFGVILSHGVLDSMPLAIAERAVEEVHRVLTPEGLFYCDLVSGDDSEHAPDFKGEEVVQTAHEKGTIQLYFNDAAIEALFGNLFDTVSSILIRRTDRLAGRFLSRYHLVLRRKP